MIVLLVALLLTTLATTMAVAAETGPVRDPYECAGLLEGAGALAPDTLRAIGERRSGADLVPVLFVHGFNSSDRLWQRDPTGDPVLAQAISMAPAPETTFAERVLQVGGTVGFTFDYSAVARQWVTDPAIGPTLGTVIDCLSTATGNRVVVIAHSMGGLATRFALGTPERAARVSTVVTLGTPNEGAGLVGPEPALDPRMQLARDLVLAGCTRDRTPLGASGCAWEGLNALAEAVAPAAVAMRPGSRELAALPEWPDAVRVVAMAGRVTFSLAGLVPGTQFAEGFAAGIGADGATDVSIGDVVVGTESALAGADSTQVFDCRPPGLDPLTRAAAGARSPCFHTHLPRLVDAAVLAASATKRAVLTDASQTDPVAAPRPRADPGPLVFLVDTSGSMAERDVNGVVRLEAAQAALRDQIRSISDRRAAALWTFPSGGADCAPGAYRLPPTLGAADQLDAEVRALRSSGNTPTGPALRALVASLQAAGEARATIVLVSDGESNCGEGPCTVAETVRGQGFDLQVDTVGFQISEEGRSELACIAGQTGGSHLDVDDGDALRQQLRTASQPILDPVLSAPAVVGPGTAVTVEASVRNGGEVAATDVGLTLRAEVIGPAGEVAGFVQVDRPALRLGNLGPDQGGGFAWTVAAPVRPSGDTLRVVLVTTAENVATATRTANLRISDRLTSADLGPVLRDAAARGPAIILGDSFSSGEGAGPYLHGQPGIPDLCHRSEDTYGKDLFGQGRHILACSGATSGALTTSQWQGRDPVPPQLKQLDELADPIGPVLLTLGGNDIGFSRIATFCAIDTKYGCDILRPLTDDQMVGLSEQLADAYVDVDRVANSAHRREQRGGAVTPIVVLAYPQIVTRQAAGRCPALSREDADYAVALVDQLNAQISVAVAKAHARGVPVLFAADVAQALLPDHTLCTDAPWVNPLELADPKLLRSAYRVEKMHPTAEGYGAFTAALIRWSQRAHLPLPDRLPTKTFTLATATDSGYTIKLGPESGLLRRGETVTVQAGGFAPGADVLVVQRSVVDALGAGTADEQGNISLTVTLPQNAHVGAHRLVALGTDPDGRPHEVASAIQVSGEAPPWLWISAAVLALAAAVATVPLLRRRKKV